MCIKFIFHVVIVLIVLDTVINKKGQRKKSNFKYEGKRNWAPKPTKTMCVDYAFTLRARKKTCFLRPDTGPCRADIIQWYYDVKQRKCYRFFWGGCQGNGNKFETQKQCLDFCFINNTATVAHRPNFCSLAFNYGSCYGLYHRWSWDSFSKTCKRHLYSGCGGNQNNFETRAECFNTCFLPPNNTLIRNIKKHQTTCVPLDVNDLN